MRSYAFEAGAGFVLDGELHWLHEPRAAPDGDDGVRRRSRRPARRRCCSSATPGGSSTTRPGTWTATSRTCSAARSTPPRPTRCWRRRATTTCGWSTTARSSAPMPGIERPHAYHLIPRAASQGARGGVPHARAGLRARGVHRDRRLGRGPGRGVGRRHVLARGQRRGRPSAAPNVRVCEGANGAGVYEAVITELAERRLTPTTRPAEPGHRQRAAGEQEHQRAAGERDGDLLLDLARGEAGAEAGVDLLELGAVGGLVEPAAADRARSPSASRCPAGRGSAWCRRTSPGPRPRRRACRARSRRSGPAPRGRARRPRSGRRRPAVSLPSESSTSTAGSRRVPVPLASGTGVRAASSPRSSPSAHRGAADRGQPVERGVDGGAVGRGRRALLGEVRERDEAEPERLGQLVGEPLGGADRRGEPVRLDVGGVHRARDVGDHHHRRRALGRGHRALRAGERDDHRRPARAAAAAAAGGGGSRGAR